MTEMNAASSKKFLFAIPDNILDLSPQEIDVYSEQLHDEIMQVLGENQLTPERIVKVRNVAIIGSSFVGLIEGVEKLAAVYKFMEARLNAGKLKCQTSWCLACETIPLRLGENPLDHVVKISLPTILDLLKIVEVEWMWAWPDDEWALSHGKAPDHFKELVERKSRPNFVIRPVDIPNPKVGQN
jgi:hypothetical protein